MLRSQLRAGETTLETSQGTSSQTQASWKGQGKASPTSIPVSYVAANANRTCPHCTASKWNEKEFSTKVSHNFIRRINAATFTTTSAHSWQTIAVCAREFQAITASNRWQLKVASLIRIPWAPTLCGIQRLNRRRLAIAPNTNSNVQVLFIIIRPQPRILTFIIMSTRVRFSLFKAPLKRLGLTLSLNMQRSQSHGIIWQRRAAVDTLSVTSSIIRRLRSIRRRLARISKHVHLHCRGNRVTRLTADIRPSPTWRIMSQLLSSMKKRSRKPQSSQPNQPRISSAMLNTRRRMEVANVSISKL